MKVVAVILTVLATLAPHGHRTPKYEPYHGCTQLGGCSHFAVPPCIVNAESKGLVHEHSHPDYASGLYQEEAATWRAMGGTRWAALPYLATKHEQSWVAYKLWDHGLGASQWETAAGCGY